MISLGRSGFLFIEAILGVVIISACFLGLVSVISNSTLANIRLDVSCISTMLARGKLAEMMAKDFDSIASVPNTNFGGSFSQYNYAVTSSYVDEAEPELVVAGPTELKKIDVAVTYDGLAGSVHLYGLKVKLP